MNKMIFNKIYGFIGVSLMIILLVLLTLIIDIVLIIDGTKHRNKWERNIGIVLTGFVMLSNLV